MGETFVMRPDIRRAAEEDAPQVAELIATAFAQLKVVSYLVPDRRERHKILTANFRIFVDHALEHGEIHLIDDAHAAAVWFPHTAPLPAPPDYDRRLAECAGEWVEHFRVLDALFEEHHPAEPHHYLAFLAVHPDRQNQGLGSALLRHHHGRMGGVAAYLEASSTGSRDLYARHGYQVRDPFALPDGTMFWPMWRPGGS
ncbi:GNAT family N-acetyltransferase [Nonomuraea turcica]|uniref:GNAT family N-acetyltransferase n=1 Tax=Nonomuraea sp. G32 TaxID=3067274 RepID=UPI00273B93E2|nr:GNAT family N-acetyltransferase [Nonomuraea sp. G32]MDP4510782.1 GNAT family N-acetyltransferase [Nonomuraea sp. G32]